MLLGERIISLGSRFTQKTANLNSPTKKAFPETNISKEPLLLPKRLNRINYRRFPGGNQSGQENREQHRNRRATID